jgi:hypothetical protein
MTDHRVQKEPVPVAQPLDDVPFLNKPLRAAKPRPPGEDSE